jgi:hypothetical protein
MSMLGKLSGGQVLKLAIALLLVEIIIYVKFSAYALRLAWEVVFYYGNHDKTPYTLHSCRRTRYTTCP